MPISISRVTSRAAATDINSDTGLFIPIRASLSLRLFVRCLTLPPTLYFAYIRERDREIRDDLLLLNNDMPCTHEGRPTTANIKASRCRVGAARDDLDLLYYKKHYPLYDKASSNEFPTDNVDRSLGTRF